MNLFLTLISIIIIYLLFKSFTKFLKIPTVVSLLIFGIFVTLPGLREIFIGNNEKIIEILGHLGLFALMFLSGLESSWKEIKSEKKDSLILALTSSIIQFLLGFIIFLILGYSQTVSFIVALSMSITAEGTKARVLFDLGKLKTRVASTMMGSGIIDDVLGLSIFSIFMFSIGSIELTEHLVLIGVIVFFTLGIAVQKFARQHHITKKLEILSEDLFVPFFFVAMGLQFDISALFIDYKLLLIILILALVGKLIGSLIAKPWVDFNKKQLYLIGWAMNSRGGVELALILVALNAKIISSDLYSILVLMSLITTIIFPFFMNNLIKNNKGIMN